MIPLFETLRHYPELAVFCVTCLLTAFAASKILGFDTGTAVGMLAGVFSESTVTYLIGTTTIVWFLSSLAPKMLKVDIREASRKLSDKIAGKPETEPGVDSAFRVRQNVMLEHRLP